MFTCYRLVDKATTDDDLPSPGITLAEAVQLSRQDPGNVKYLIKKAVQKLESQQVLVRLKSLRFMLHLAQNGPPACLAEIKLQTTPISNCISWRGQPHPTRGFEPYQEMQDAAQSLLDMAFSQNATSSTSTFSYNPQQNNLSQVNRVAGVSTMQAYGNDEVLTTAPSLEPRNLDPNAQNTVGNKVKGFVNRIFHKDQPQPSPYPSYSNTGSSYPAANTYSYPPGAAPSMMGGVPQAAPAQEQMFYNPAPIQQQPPPSLYGRLDQDPTWKKKKPTEDQVVQPKVISDTPASKLLKVTGNRALPTNGELSAFKNVCTPESIAELKAGLNNSDWKVKVRAIAGLEIYGDKFGVGAVADTKDTVAKLKSAPQASLRTAAERFHAKIENVQPVAPPETPSAFNFAGGAEENTNQDEQGYNFQSNE